MWELDGFQAPRYCDSMESGEIVRELMRLTPHLEIAHHVPGRIRLRILQSGLQIIQEVDFETVVCGIPGVLDIRVNPLARSVVVQYDRERLPSDFWEGAEELKSRPEQATEYAARLQALWDR